MSRTNYAISIIKGLYILYIGLYNAHVDYPHSINNVWENNMKKTQKTTITIEVEPHWKLEYVQYHFLDSELKDYIIERELYSEYRNYYYLFKRGQLLTDDATQNRVPVLYNTLSKAKRAIELDLEDSDYHKRDRQIWTDPIANYVSRPLYLRGVSDE